MAAAPTDLAAVLADPTRFHIYETLAHSRPRSYTAQEIARRFYLHPNVARTHLSRLEEIGLVESFLEKSGRGGRPARRYRAVDRAVTLQFPRRDWLWLARLLIRTVEELGTAAMDAAQRQAYEEGLDLGRRLTTRPAPGPERSPVAPDARGSVASGLSFQEWQELLQREAGAHSLTRRQDGALSLCFTTCVLREVAQEHRQTVCALHRAYLQGLIEGLMGPVEMNFAGPMLLDADAPCEWVICSDHARAGSAAQPASRALSPA